MFNLGTSEIMIILVVALLLLGPQQLPEIGKQIGKMLREFRNMSGDVQRALDLDGHNDYDQGYTHRVHATDYGYADRNALPAVEPEPEPVETKAFAYSAPTHGTPVAAIGAVEETPASDIVEHLADKFVEPAETITGARVYNEPEKKDVVQVSSSSAVI